MPSRLCRPWRRAALQAQRHARYKSTTHTLQPKLAETDSCGIPLRPTWSVNELLSSYPKPTISPAKLKRLHELSALIPPQEGTLEHAKLTSEMENLVKLVEAVKTVAMADETAGLGVPDGRIWDARNGIVLEHDMAEGGGGGGSVNGRALLSSAARTEDGLYVVDADRTR